MNKRPSLAAQQLTPRRSRSEADGDSEEPPSPAPVSPSEAPHRSPQMMSAVGPAPARSSRPRSASSRRRQLSVATLEALPVAEPLVIAPEAPPRVRSLRQLQVVVAHSLALSLERGRPEDRIADEETSAVAQAVAAALRGRVRRVEVAPVWDDFPAVLQRYDPHQVVVFNLVESLGGRAFTEPEAPRILEAMGFLHTGASYQSLQRSANKLTTKKLLEAAGLTVPRYQVFRHGGQRNVTVPLPAIVKPVAEGGSFGVTQESVARTREELLERVQRCLELYRQPALAEEFIVGREINVALWGNQQPTVLPISEVVFHWTRDPLQQFVTFESKWMPETIEYRGTPVLCPAPLSDDDRQRIESAAIQAYQVIGLRGYGRVDIRLRDGVPYILEVNANPDLAPDAGFFRSAAAAGYTYSQTICHILKLAIASG